MTKKGQGLSMTMIVVIILALLVLLVIALIFLGGSTGLSQRLKNIFLPQQAIAVDLARQNCQQWCSLAESMTPEDARQSAYCTSYQEGVDLNPRDGNPDKDGDGKLIRYYCSQDAAGRGANVFGGERTTASLDVNCGVSCQ